jgi:hypothetical protein
MDDLTFGESGRPRIAHDRYVEPLENVAQRRDALDLLCALSTACALLAFFDPQHRGVLDRLKFGNEGGRQRGRARLPAMTEDYIDACCGEIGGDGITPENVRDIAGWFLPPWRRARRRTNPTIEGSDAFGELHRREIAIDMNHVMRKAPLDERNLLSGKQDFFTTRDRDRDAK